MGATRKKRIDLEKKKGRNCEVLAVDTVQRVCARHRGWANNQHCGVNAHGKVSAPTKDKRRRPSQHCQGSQAYQGILWQTEILRRRDYQRGWMRCLLLPTQRPHDLVLRTRLPLSWMRRGQFPGASREAKVSVVFKGYTRCQTSVLFLINSVAFNTRSTVIYVYGLANSIASFFAMV